MKNTCKILIKSIRRGVSTYFRKLLHLIILWLSQIKNTLKYFLLRKGIQIHNLQHIIYVLIIGSSIPFYTRIHFILISLTKCYYIFNYKDLWDPGLFKCQTLLFIDFVEGVIPCVSEAHCGCTSFHKYVITINTLKRIWISPFFV